MSLPRWKPGDLVLSRKAFVVCLITSLGDGNYHYDIYYPDTKDYSTDSMRFGHFENIKEYNDVRVTKLALVYYDVKLPTKWEKHAQV